MNLNFEPRHNILELMNDINNPSYMSGWKTGKRQSIAYSVIAEALYLSSMPIDILLIANSEHATNEFLNAFDALDADITIKDLRVDFNVTHVSVYIFPLSQIMANYTAGFVFHKVFADVYVETGRGFTPSEYLNCLTTVKNNNLIPHSGTYRDEFVGVPDHYIDLL